MRLKPPLLHKPRLRVVLALGMAVACFTGLALSQATPALADPTQTLVVVGSDTIQDIWDQYGIDASGNLIGSYDAVNPVTQVAHEIITPVDGSANVKCSFVRPNGSSEGVANLRLALNPATTNGGAAIQPAAGQGCVDIARSSSAPASTLLSTTGPIIYIPFALDAVAGSVGPANAASCPASNPCPSFPVVTPSNGTVTVSPVSTAITTADSFTLADLQTMYDNCATVTEGGVTYDPTGTIAGDTKIDLYIPQPGSGTRNFWATTLNFNATTPPSCVHDHIVGGVLSADNVAVEEHNGTAVVSDPNGFGPFSIAQWISQGNGHNDRRHGVTLHNLNGITPLTTTGSLNTSFPITRDVYDVVSFARVTTTSDPLFALLNGPNSFTCNEKGQILSYGFALIGTTCGQINQNLRVVG